jgi:hypothetical protein
MNDIIINSVFNVRRAIIAVKKFFIVAIILGEKERGLALAVEKIVAELAIESSHRRRCCGCPFEGWDGTVFAPGPAVPEPKGGQEVNGGGFRTTIMHGDENENFVGRGFGIFNEDVEIAVTVKNTSIDQFVLGF